MTHTKTDTITAFEKQMRKYEGQIVIHRQEVGRVISKIRNQQLCPLFDETVPGQYVDITLRGVPYKKIPHFLRPRYKTVYSHKIRLGHPTEQELALITAALL